MVTVTINPDKTWTLAFNAKTQAAIDFISSVRDASFWQDWINAKFSEMTRRTRQIESEDIVAKFQKIPAAQKKQIRDILEGR